MEFINATKLQAGYTHGVQPDGRELLVVVAKGTFAIPQFEEEPSLAEEQVPLVMTDVFTGEPGFSAPLYEMDFAPRKPHCDVLLNGSAYAPGGKPTDRVTVSLRVGALTKSFDVVGKRVWEIGLLGPRPSQPEPFTKAPISYNYAFGGVDRSQEDPAKHRWYPTNHVGIGYHEYTLLPKYIDGMPFPNTEETSNKVTNPRGNYRPMAFGPLGRAWQQRVKLAGTYDKNWLDNQFPFLPTDFNEEYYQAAPADQWMDYPKGGEEVDLVNLTPQERCTFRLPTMPVPVEFFRRDGERIEMSGVIDTLLIEPDLGRFTMSARCSLPLKKNIHEMECVVVGIKPRRWYEEEGLVAPPVTEKRRFRSLDAMIKAKKQRSAASA
jgi:hypothetical protein